MGWDLRAEALLQSCREVAVKLRRKLGCIGQVGGEKFRVERHFRIGQQHREFRAREPLTVHRPVGEGLVIGQEFQRPIKPPRFFEIANQPRLTIERR